MSKWFYLNGFLLLVAIWKLIEHAIYSSIQLPVWLGLAGLLFFLFNWTRQAVFSTIRNHPKRKVKVRLAQLSKKVVPFHRYTGTAALILIIFHAFLMLQRYGFALQTPKILIGLLAGITLVFMVLSGWLRLFWPSVKKRYLHIYLGMTLFVLICIHVIL
ncbi:hypothetical protein P5G51_012520 [Virgibacillus sp. 179-BFC.A HS]|uniref:Ferric oxidoreductase domain-containing protein n=1 Tax=Tigheibacillus jepli TaxID=3035914 RepID=A0ABU5CJT6_9BACI|nr:hypothetical protein [Virgibacillus sp. 179-BFC.A HS]MDY0406107.1 hypothetical protein [Virgibacillus sp. 179-BFC.A HS]